MTNERKAAAEKIVAAAFAILVVWIALHYLSDRACKNPETTIITFPVSKW